MRRFFLWFWWLIFALFISGRVVAFVTESWWYAQQGQQNVYLTILSTRLLLFTIGAAFVTGVLDWNLRFAWRAEKERRQQLNREIELQLRPVFDAPLEENMAPPNPGLENLRRWAWRFGLGFCAFIGGGFASFNWPLWLRAFNAVPTQKRDPIFGLDAGFYFFHLPALQFVWAFVFVVLCLTLIAVFLVYGHDHDFDLRSHSPALSPHALRHLSVLLTAIFVWKSLGYRLDSYELLTTAQAAINGESLTGVAYTDARVRLPLMVLMSVLALGAAAIIWWAGKRNELRHAVWTVGIYLGLSALLLVFVPGLTQALRVDPQGEKLQEPYLQHHISWTRWAYGLENVADVRASKQSSTQDAFPHLRQPQDIEKAVSLWNEDELMKRLYRASDEFVVTSVAFGVRKIGEEWRPVYFAARELSPVVVRQNASTQVMPPGAFSSRNEQTAREANTWLQRHFRWTHGSGLIVVDANRLRRDETSTENSEEPLRYPTPPELRQPQIYFGPWNAPSPHWALSALRENNAANNAVSNSSMPRVPAAIRAERLEPLFNPDADYVILPQRDHSSAEYSSATGVPVGNGWRKFLLAWRFADPRFGFSPLINETSRVVWHRRISERCAALAPFIDWQNARPRPVIFNGRIVWILQGATSSRYAPYAQESRDGTNYYRASVVATVDAFNGETRFYISDASDVLLRSYIRAFPGLFQAWSKMPRELQLQATYSQSALEKQAETWLHLRQFESRGENGFARDKRSATTKWKTGQSFQAVLPLQESLGTASPPKVTSGVTLMQNGANQALPDACLMAMRNEDGSSQLWFWSPLKKEAPEQNPPAAPTFYLPGNSQWIQIQVERENANSDTQNSARFLTLAVHWNGFVARANNLQDAIQLLKEKQRNPVRATQTLSPPQKWQRARELAALMQGARARRDWSAYGVAEKQLMELLNPQPGKE